MGVWQKQGLQSHREILGLAEDNKNISLVHCNYLNAPVGQDMSVIYCPRTHAAFGHAPHPFRQYLAQGLNVALGSDSLASNPDLDMLAEMRFLHDENQGVSTATVLSMATLNGAHALGWANETGSISAGKSADLVILPLPNEEPADPYPLVLESNLAVKEVYFRGKVTDLSFSVRAALVYALNHCTKAARTLNEEKIKYRSTS